MLFISYLSFQYTSETGSKDESDYIPDGIVLDITLVKGQRVVTVRSPVQVCRLMCTALVYVLLEYFSKTPYLFQSSKMGMSVGK